MGREGRTGGEERGRKGRTGEKTGKEENASPSPPLVPVSPSSLGGNTAPALGLR